VYQCCVPKYDSLWQAGAPIAGELTAVTICELAMEGNITKIRTLVAIHPQPKP